VRGKVQWKDVALIVLVALLIAVPVGRISYSFGAGGGSKATSGTVAPTLDTIKAAQSDQAAAQQAVKDAKAEADKAHSMNLTDNEKEMMLVEDKTIAAVAAEQKANALVRPIEPAVRQARKKPGDLLDNAVRENVRLGVANLKSSEPILAEAVRHGAVRIIGGRYDLETGVVDVIV